MSSSVCLFSNRCQMTSKYGKNTFWQLRYSVELRQYESILFIDRKAKCSYLWRQPCVWPLIDVKEKPIKMMSVYCSICEYESDLCSNGHYLRSTVKTEGLKKIQTCTGFEFFCLFLFVFFFRPSFHYCSSSVHYCEDRFHITSLSAVHIYDFHIFTVISAYHIINYLPCMWLIYGLKHSKLRFYTRLNLYIELKMAGLPVFDKVGGSSLWIRPSKRKHLKLR